MKTEAFLTILLGWLFGLLTPGIAERIRRPYRRRDLVRSVVDELLGLQYTMAMVALRIRARRAEVSDAFLEEILPIIEGYQGPDRDPGLIEGIRRSRESPEADRVAMHQAIRKPNVGLYLPQYEIPLFVTQIADLTICGLAFQRSVLHIRFHLDLYNQHGSYVQSMVEKTFGKPTQNDLAALIANQEQSCQEAGTRAETIMRAITNLQQRYPTRK
jgi:hypothetical protein